MGSVGSWEVGAAQALFADAPAAVLAGPPTRPFHPTFLPRSAPSSDLVVMEIAELSILFFVGNVHQIVICKGNNVDAESKIPFAISGVASRGAADHVVASPKCSKAGGWSITVPCDCKLCLLVCLLPSLPNWTKFT